MSSDHTYEGLVETRQRLVRAEYLIEDAVGWLSDIMAEDSTRDGDPPSDKDVMRWVEDWLSEANDYLNGDNNE